jgi:hypothetical protein
MPLVFLVVAILVEILVVIIAAISVFLTFAVEIIVGACDALERLVQRHALIIVLGARPWKTIVLAILIFLGRCNGSPLLRDVFESFPAVLLIILITVAFYVFVLLVLPPHLAATLFHIRLWEITTVAMANRAHEKTDGLAVKTGFVLFERTTNLVVWVICVATQTFGCDSGLVWNLLQTHNMLCSTKNKASIEQKARSHLHSPNSFSIQTGLVASDLFGS